VAQFNFSQRSINGPKIQLYLYGRQVIGKRLHKNCPKGAVTQRKNSVKTSKMTFPNEEREWEGKPLQEWRTGKLFKNKMANKNNSLRKLCRIWK